MRSNQGSRRGAESRISQPGVGSTESMLNWPNQPKSASQELILVVALMIGSS